jgi:hypothetical protein
MLPRNAAGSGTTSASDGSISRRELLLLAGGAACGLLLPGCGGGGGGGAAPFTVIPNRAAPGSVVTLTGLQATGATPTVMFGASPAIIHQQTLDGLQVLVPPFFKLNTLTVATPSAPVAVTVQSGGATRAATNTFTVADLPLAPGAAQGLVADMAGMAVFFQDFFQKGLFPAFGDPSNGPVTALDRAPLIQGAAFAAAAADLFAGPDNPNCLVNVFAGKAPATGGGKLPMDVLDALIAQGPALGQMGEFVQLLHDTFMAIAPESVTSNAGQAQKAAHARDQMPHLHFSDWSVNWSNLSSAQVIIVQLEVQRFLAGAVNSNNANFLNMFYTIGMSALQIIALVTAQPEVLAAVEATDLAVSVGSKLLAVVASVMPGQVTDFYVQVMGVNRRTGSPAVDIPITTHTPLKVFLVTASSGGLAFSAAGLAELILQVAEKKCPPLASLLEHASTGATVLYKLYVTRMISFADSIWQLMAGSGPPADWAATQALNFPVHKYTPANVNDARAVTLTSNSSLLTIGVNADHSSYFVGVKQGPQAGYTANLTTKALVPGLPSLSDLTPGQDTVRGYVAVVSGTLNLGLN